MERRGRNTKLVAAGIALASAAAARRLVRAVRSFRAYRRAFVPILLYHALSDNPATRHDYVVRRRDFERQMRWLARSGYETVTCAALTSLADPASCPGRKLVAISFDDGFASVYQYGLPVLRGLGMSATLFVATDYVEYAAAFPWPYAAGDPPLSVEEVRELAGLGFEIASHSCSHPDLRVLGDADLMGELAGSWAAIGRWLGAAPATFAYPFGHCDARVQDAVRAAGYGGAFGVFVAPEHAGTFAIPRTLVRNQTSLLGFRLRVWGLHPYVKTRRWFRLLRPLLRRRRWAFW
jgi:peptidoglycan/xylan/chitin deacetylase (PgdA/CDA1 family)